MKNLKDATKPFSDGEELGVEVIETTISPSAYDANGVSPHDPLPISVIEQDNQPLSRFSGHLKNLSVIHGKK